LFLVLFFVVLLFSAVSSSVQLAEVSRMPAHRHNKPHLRWFGISGTAPP